MSRGPGSWQRILTTALDEYRMVEVNALAWHHLQREPLRSELVALRRAAKKIVMADRATAFTMAQCRGCHESYTKWVPCCPGAGMGRVLVLTIDAKLSASIPNCMKPLWVSVAPAGNGIGATLTGSAAGSTS